mmetsp:Transcript_16063/g.16194  ORF Transcript_16063/g.16194 Transcript_16063/m.16194 type:complete len:88 (-) Transcript_16063:2031-2294(-)
MVQLSSMSSMDGSELHPFSICSMQQFDCPQPFEQIAFDKVPGIRPGVALQHPLEQISSCVPAQRPELKHEPEQTPLIVQSISSTHGL